ncbi:hypothetical protein DY000_02018012 [Brassica cretica]|uniref:Uncharacterized protein n=1 Tax=Brassica cretica TaxID=69181 RepID=A0ABQ7DB22_BRACR|nr:hypothetical protein DY000_02018012 [Brassica cretica]
MASTVLLVLRHRNEQVLRKPMKTFLSFRACGQLRRKIWKLKKNCPRWGCFRLSLSKPSHSLNLKKP